MFAKFYICHFLRGTENIKHSEHVHETASSLIEPFCFNQLIRPKDYSIKSWQDLFGGEIISSYLIHSHQESLPSKSDSRVRAIQNKISQPWNV